MENKATILLVEDDLSLGYLLSDLLSTEQYQVKLCRDGHSGLHYFKQHPVDLCILDIMMPEMDGFTLARHIRRENAGVPFLFLTAKLRKEDKLTGYALGADDYITKPFDEEELLCKIRVILRRQPAQQSLESQPAQFRLGRYFFDYSLQQLSLNDQSQRLTEKENEVLRLLCLNQNQILRRDEAVERIYGKYDYFLGRSFDVFISRLRKRLGEDPRISIENVFKVGFILRVEG